VTQHPAPGTSDRRKDAPMRRMTAAILTALLSLGVAACDGGPAEDPTVTDPSAESNGVGVGDEPGADPGAELPADTGEQDL
jgi:hypothetical protein